MNPVTMVKPEGCKHHEKNMCHHPDLALRGRVCVLTRDKRIGDCKHFTELIEKIEIINFPGKKDAVYKKFSGLFSRGNKINKLKELKQENKRLNALAKQEPRVIEVPQSPAQGRFKPMQVHQIRSRFLKYGDNNPLIFDERTGAIYRLSGFEITDFGNVLLSVKPRGMNVFKKDIKLLVQDPLRNIRPTGVTPENPDGTIKIWSNPEHIEQQTVYQQPQLMQDWQEPIERTMYLQELEKHRSGQVTQEQAFILLDNLTRRVSNWRDALTTFGEQKKILFGTVPKSEGGSG